MMADMPAPTFTPQSWPEGTWPTVEQLTDWLEACTRDERERYVAGSIQAAVVSSRCQMEQHPEVLVSLQASVAQAYMIVGEVRKLHVPSGLLVCANDTALWPCKTAKLVYSKEELRR